MKKASDLYRILKKIENLVRRNESSDGTCGFDTLKVYILLQAAKDQISKE